LTPASCRKRFELCGKQINAETSQPAQSSSGEGEDETAEATEDVEMMKVVHKNKDVAHGVAEAGDAEEQDLQGDDNKDHERRYSIAISSVAISGPGGAAKKELNSGKPGAATAAANAEGSRNNSRSPSAPVQQDGGRQQHQQQQQQQQQPMKISYNTNVTTRRYY